MYALYETKNGYDGSFQIQDGMEYFHAPTLNEAIFKMIESVKFMNGISIEKSDIKIYKSTPQYISNNVIEVKSQSNHKIDYERFKSIPTEIKQYAIYGWIVGGAAKHIAGLTNKLIDDYDIIIPYHNWHKVKYLIPKNARPNTFGGWKFSCNNSIIDLWVSDLSDFFLTVDNPSENGIAYNLEKEL